MAFSALLSCETPTTAFRIRIVRIYLRPGLAFCRAQALNFGITYNNRVNECAPATFVLEQGEDKRDGGGTKEDQDELVFELFKNKLPQGCRRLLRYS